MKTKRIILFLAAAALFMGCFKDVSYKTTYVFKPLEQEKSGDPTQILLQEFLICLEIHLQHGHFTMGRILIRAFNGNTVLYNIVCQKLRCHET